MEANYLINNLNNMEFQCRNVDLEKVILVEIELEYSDHLAKTDIEEKHTSNHDRQLDLYKHCAKLYVPKDKISGSFIEQELEKTGGNYMKVII
jgi:hypothetical protein